MNSTRYSIKVIGFKLLSVSNFLTFFSAFAFASSASLLSLAAFNLLYADRTLLKLSPTLSILSCIAFCPAFQAFHLIVNWDLSAADARSQDPPFHTGF
ncbi:MAG: hypothetical protein MKZ96_06250 [Candidatus Atelocyanobacterium sp. ALOHA_A2.5_9]|nr:hypothetical protein [Candidatus Atelocyanobacterium sp. ALOHA_A2.5_9]